MLLLALLSLKYYRRRTSKWHHPFRKAADGLLTRVRAEARSIEFASLALKAVNLGLRSQGGEGSSFRRRSEPH